MFGKMHVGGQGSGLGRMLGDAKVTRSGIIGGIHSRRAEIRLLQPSILPHEDKGRHVLPPEPKNTGAHELV